MLLEYRASMANDTLVRFVNSTDQPLTIKPANSSIGRFDRFTLKPGESREIRGNNPGSGNYDLEWDPLINPKGKDKDIPLGTVRADNPWLTDPYIESLANNMWFAGTNYFDFKSNSSDLRPDSSFYYKKVGIKQAKASRDLYYGQAGSASMQKGIAFVSQGAQNTSLSKIDVYYTTGHLQAMNREIPIAKVAYGGLSGGAYIWDFNVGYY